MENENNNFIKSDFKKDSDSFESPDSGASSAAPQEAHVSPAAETFAAAEIPVTAEIAAEAANAIAGNEVAENPAFNSIDGTGATPAANTYTANGSPAYPGATPANTGANPVYPGATPTYPGATPTYPGATPTYPGATPVYEPAGKKKKKKKLLKRKSFWAFVIILIALIAIIAGTSSDSSGSSGSSSSSSSSSSSYVNPFVNVVKTTKHSSYGITYGAAFDSFFTNPKWKYFEASTGEHVVEFEGGFLYDNSPATATVQFIVDLDEGTLTVYHLSINDVAQSKLMLSTLVQKVFESY